jgi:hypothetical protein
MADIDEFGESDTGSATLMMSSSRAKRSRGYTSRNQGGHMTSKGQRANHNGDSTGPNGSAVSADDDLFDPTDRP